mmetsp:Transcript_22489/g.48982  ORF Transcript_22489/g.48982 Transcript_22489/m.48982 type:complete len:248 (-) Transcript_22489:233-976(-)
MLGFVDSCSPLASSLAGGQQERSGFQLGQQGARLRNVQTRAPHFGSNLLARPQTVSVFLLHIQNCGANVVQTVQQILAVAAGSEMIFQSQPLPTLGLPIQLRHFFLAGRCQDRHGIVFLVLQTLDGLVQDSQCSRKAVLGFASFLFQVAEVDRDLVPGFQSELTKILRRVPGSLDVVAILLVILVVLVVTLGKTNAPCAACRRNGLGLILFIHQVSGGFVPGIILMIDTAVVIGGGEDHWFVSAFSG